MGVRMFTAVLPPKPVIDQLDALLDPRRDVASKLRWTRPEGWHLTCSFMAEVPLAAVPLLEAALADVAARSSPFEVGLDGGVTFPHPVKARILAMRVGSGHDELADLSTRCRTAGARCGIQVDNARFVGHLTLARHNRGFHATKWLEVLGSFPKWRWPVDRLVLLQSNQGYHVTASFPLLG